MAHMTEFVKLCEYISSMLFLNIFKLMNTCFRRQYLYQSLPSSSQFLGCPPKNQGVTVVGQTKHRWQGQKHTIVRLISQNSSKKTWCPRRSKHNHHLLYHLLYNTARFLIWCLTTAVLKDTPCITLNPARDETQSRPSIVQRCAEGHRLSSASCRKEFLCLHSVAKIDTLSRPRRSLPESIVI
jgi:hypothetical protein